MSHQFRPIPPHPSMPHRQRGTMLIIALIVLVAMTLAGIAAMRSVDTASIVAGNVGFRQASVSAADEGLQAAYTWLSVQVGTAGALDNTTATTSNSTGYSAHVQPTGDPDWTQSATWQTAALVNGGVADAAGNVVAYLVDRMCTCDGSTNATCASTGQPNSCGSTATTPGSSGACEGCDQSQPNYFTLPPAVHYRVNARAVGPRASVAIVQVMLRGQ